MVNYTPDTLDTVFSALSDPTRRAILVQLQRGEATVTELASPFSTSLPAISKHLRVLENAGLIARRKEGRTHYVRLVAAPLQSAAEWLTLYRRFWNSTFDALDRFLAVDDDGPTRESDV
jgi:DNA-binding transcriptional ArsR family regulator